MKTQTLKGFRDFLPQDARKRQFVISQLKTVFETFGFEPLETPTLEYEEVLAGKYGEEGEKLMYRFEDNGKRRVAMRYDQTVPLARVVAQYGSATTPDGQPLLPMPFKRYQIQNVWRAENTQKGRYREFLQCDIDSVGLNSLAVDSEIVALVARALTVLGFQEYRILINDRRVFGDLPIEAIITIDKLKKIGADGVKKELVAKGFSEDALDKVQNAQLPDSVREVIATAKKMGADESAIVFEPTLARGLDYYTGMIIEVEIPQYTVGSVGGGGRYDNLLGLFSNKDFPAVGFAFGFDRIIEAMTEQNLFPENLIATASVLVTVFGAEYTEASIEVAQTLRARGITTELWLEETTKMDKQLKYANQKNIPYVVVIGPEEIERKYVTLKNMKTRTQQQVTIEEAISNIKAN
ncbi:MAG: histidine--tRNA ligase [Candidatus Levybacteria bacterium]|nr:histidine--tRNA ligase [Candidatus Levybacteria bacterium]